MRDYPYDSVRAPRVLGQGYAYLLTAMRHRGEHLGLTPSTLVDVGVHTVILDTVTYLELCERFNGGHFLHRVPEVDAKDDGSVLRTADPIAANGWRSTCRTGRTPPSADPATWAATPTDHPVTR